MWRELHHGWFTVLCFVVTLWNDLKELALMMIKYSIWEHIKSRLVAKLCEFKTLNGTGSNFANQVALSLFLCAYTHMTPTVHQFHLSSLYCPYICYTHIYLICLKSLCLCFFIHIAWEPIKEHAATSAYTYSYVSQHKVGLQRTVELITSNPAMMSKSGFDMPQFSQIPRPCCSPGCKAMGQSDDEKIDRFRSGSRCVGVSSYNSALHDQCLKGLFHGGFSGIYCIVPSHLVNNPNNSNNPNSPMYVCMYVCIYLTLITLNNPNNPMCVWVYIYICM